MPTRQRSGSTVAWFDRDSRVFQTGSSTDAAAEDIAEATRLAIRR